MTGTDARLRIIQQLTTAAQSDPRIVGVVDYGSSSEGRADKWSDVDVALFLRDEDFETFKDEWSVWAARFGTLLLAYIGSIGHPWAVYDTSPVPLRVDFAFHRETEMSTMLSWPNAPLSAAAMVLYDETGGNLTGYAERMVGQSLGPLDVGRAFEQVSGDFWYYMLRTWVKLQRGQWWAARFDYNFILLGNLLALLRIEADALERFRATSAAVGIEQALSGERLRRLNACIAEAGRTQLLKAFMKAGELAYEVCAATAQAHGWTWPRQLAERALTLLKEVDEGELPDS
jgi:lincosamide nucleotidyltransferase